MGLFINFKDLKIGVGDVIKVSQKISEKGKDRVQTFEGQLIAIKGNGGEKTITVRRIGAQKVGIERIFPLNSTTIEKIDVVKKGTSGVRHSKLYFVRNKSKKEIDKIYSRSSRKK